MRLIIDTDENTLTEEIDGNKRVLDVYSRDAFQLISNQWLKTGWGLKYSYSFTWLGRPIIQLPEDMIRTQEVIYSLKPDVIIETGIAHGGSLIFYASLCQLMGKGGVVGVDIEIRPHNRKAIESHPFFPFITLIEGSSTDPVIIDQVKAHIQLGDTVLVLLDSCHTKEHVLEELRVYAPLVTKNSYIVATDGVMEQVVGAPYAETDWTWNNPKEAALEFVEQHPEFVIQEPPFLFNEGNITERITYWPSAFIKRIG